MTPFEMIDRNTLDIENNLLSREELIDIIKTNHTTFKEYETRFEHIENKIRDHFDDIDHSVRIVYLFLWLTTSAHFILFFLS